MRWTERQRAMLREMGIRLWLPEDEAVGATSVVAATAAGATIAGDALPSARSSSPSSPASTVAAPRAAAVRAEEPQRLPGLAPADWLVVGDALDPADPQQQQLLENMLRAIGVGLVAPTREHRAVYVAVDATPIATAIAAVAPRCVLALGKAAAAALLGADAPLGGLRGRVHAHAGVAVVVTFAPAFLLRHPAEKAKAWADLCLAVGALSA
jgi:DNA polymerase